MAVPLRVLVLGIVIIVAVASAVAIYFPLNDATTAAVDALVAKLRADTSTNLVQIARSQFDPVRALAQTAQVTINGGAINTTDGTRLLSAIPLLCFIGNTSAYLVQMGLPSRDYAGCQAGLAYYRDPANLNMYTSMTDAPLRQLNKSRYVLNTNNYNVLGRPWYQQLQSGNSWSQFYVRTGNPATSTTAVGGPLYNPRTGAFMGVMSVSMHSLSFIAAMQKVVVADTGRAMVYDANSGYFLAGNFNQSAAIVANTTTGALRLVWVNDTRDELIVAAVNLIGGQSALLALPPAFAASFSWGEDTLYVDVSPITDAYGLNLRVLSVIRRSDFTGSIDGKQRAAVGIAAGVVAVLALLCAGLVWWVMSPLGNLAESMSIEKSMTDDAEEAVSHSSLTEVHAIQVAYQRLCAELRMVRSYLPSTLVNRLQCEARGEDPDLEDNTSVPWDARSRSSRTGSRRPDAQSQSAGRHSKSNNRVAVGASEARSKSDPRMRASVTGIAAIEAALAPQTRRISVVALNLVGLHQVASSRGEHALAAISAKYVDIVFECAGASRGVVHMLHGDRAFLTFNAAARTASHATQAMDATEAIRVKVASELNMDITAGVATGEAVIGLLGNATAKQFSVVGRPFLHATVLERLCRCKRLLPYRCAAEDTPTAEQRRNITVLLDRATFAVASYTISLRGVDVVALPQSSRVQLIATMLTPEEKQLAALDSGAAPGSVTDGSAAPEKLEASATNDREWMYELNRQLRSNVFTRYTEALDAYAQGRFDEAVSMLDSAAPCPAALRHLYAITKARLVALGPSSTATAGALAVELGDFYSATA